jgi:hypothetical protein
MHSSTHVGPPRALINNYTHSHMTLVENQSCKAVFAREKNTLKETTLFSKTTQVFHDIKVHFKNCHKHDM